MRLVSPRFVPLNHAHRPRAVAVHVEGNAEINLITHQSHESVAQDRTECRNPPILGAVVLQNCTLDS